MKKLVPIDYQGGALTATEYELVEFGESNGCLFTHRALTRRGAVLPLQPTPQRSAATEPPYEYLVMGIWGPLEQIDAPRRWRPDWERIVALGLNAVIWVGIGAMIARGF